MDGRKPRADVPSAEQAGQLAKLLADFKVWAGSAFVILLAWGLFACFLAYGSAENRDAQLNTELETFRAKISAILKTYERFADYVSDSVQTQEIRDLLVAAASADESGRNELRSQLYSKLLPEYDAMMKYQYSQFHFQLPDGTSFLRFHAPETFGDNLSEMRPSIRIVSTSHEKVTGFEAGRVTCGYRFVYPMFQDNRYIGSVELAISASSLSSILHELYPEMETYYLIRKATVEGTVLAKYQDSYVASRFSPEYLADRDLESMSNGGNSLLTEVERNNLLTAVQAEIDENLAQNEDFTIIARHGNHVYEMLFTAIRNTSGNADGYYACIQENTSDGSLLDAQLREQIFLAVLCITFLIFSFLYARSQIKMRRLSETDFLTGTFSRMKFMQLGRRELERFRRTTVPFAVLLLDLDHFKQINDQFGHDEGDAVLRELARRMNESLRTMDVLARWGGEEFVILLPDTGIEGATNAAERIRRLAADKPFGIAGSITVSIGIAVSSIDDATVDAVVTRADSLMYRAKALGRNRSVSPESSVGFADEMIRNFD